MMDANHMVGPDGEPIEFGEFLPGATFEERAQLIADALDGAALRRLREALPPTTVIRVEGPWGPGGWTVGVVLLPLDPAGDTIRPYRTGATIAEAADKCREALG